MGAGGVGSALTLFGAYSESQSQIAMGDYQNRMAKINAKYAQMQADRALERGDLQATEFLKKSASILGAQKTAYAASGVEVGYGSGRTLAEQTKVLSALDAEEIRSNAFLEAMGYRQAAQETLRGGRMAQSMGRISAAQTLLAGGFKAEKNYNTFSNIWGAANKPASQDNFDVAKNYLIGE